MRAFLTARSWQASAWIASLILFALPFGLLAVALPIVCVRNGTPIPWSGEALCIALFVALCALFIRLVRTTWHRAVRAAKAGSGRDVADDAGDLTTGFAVLMVVAWLGNVATPAATAGRSASPPLLSVAGLSIAAFFVGLFSLVVFYLVRLLRRYGFAAPLYFSAILLLATVGCALIVAGTVLAFRAVPDWRVQVPGILCCRCGLVFAAQRHLVIRSTILRFVPIVLGASFLLLMIYMADDLRSGTWREGVSLGPMMRGLGGFLIWVTLPYVFACYAAVYSNSLPDWISVAMTRHLLGRAARVHSIRLFASWLLLDVVVATLCIVSTFVILVAVFNVCGWVVQVSAMLGDFDSSWEVPARMFHGSTQSLAVLQGAVLTGTAPVMDGTDTAAGVGAVLVAMLVALGATSILPTLLNAMILIGLIVARGTALVIRRPISHMHSLLVLPVGGGQGAGEPFFRSSLIIGLMLTAGLVVADLLLLQLVRFARWMW